MFNNKMAHKPNAGNTLLGVFSIATIRDYLEITLEGKSLLSQSEPLTSLKVFFLHFNSFYFLVYACLSLILYLFVQKKITISDCFRIGVLAMPLIWIGPLFDYFVIGDFDMLYPRNPMNVIRNIHHFADPNYNYEGMTMGMRFEIMLAGSGGFAFLYYKTKTIISSFLGGICISFACIFIGLLVPFLTQFYEYGFNFGYHELYNSLLLHQGFVIHGATSVIALIYLLLCLTLFSIAYYIRNKKFFLAVVGNFRWTRAIHYLMLFGCGILYIYYNPPMLSSAYDGDFEFLSTIWTHPSDILGIFMAFVAIFLSFQSAVIFNDIYDYDIDMVSNVERPLVTQEIPVSEYRLLAKLFVILALTIAFCINETFFFFVLLYHLLAFLYSAPPIRMRQFFLLSNIELAFIFLTSFHAGTTVLVSTYQFEHIPPYITFGLLLSYIIVLSIKDSKDYEGDKMSHVQTIHTLLGQRYGNIVTTISVSITILLTPVLLHLTHLLLFCASICLLFLLMIILIKKYRIKERLVTSLYFIYVSVIFYYLIFQNKPIM